MTNLRPFDRHQDATLRRLWGRDHGSIIEIATELRRGVDAVRARAVELGLPPRGKPMRPSLGWTAERQERCLAMWREGQSASQIAKALGGVSRNAVIGKIHRLGLADRGEASPPRRAKPQVAPATRTKRPPNPLGSKSQRRPAEIASPARRPLPTIVEAPGAATILTLSPRACRWPIGDPLQPGFTFCGARQGAREPYCDAHAERAYQPSRPRTEAELAADDRRRFLARQRAALRACG